MFRGISVINIDGKGRVVMPARYREQLQSEGRDVVVLTIDTEEKCLLLYSLPVWEEIEMKLSNLPSFNPASRRIQRLLIGHATEVEIDGQGRILVPPVLRDYAGLDKRIMLVGQGKKFELWNETDWQNRRDAWLEMEAEESLLPDEMKTLSL